MKQDKQDRRSRRTRHLVHSAFMELLLEKRYEAITVRDILNRSGIGSSTFYSHYFDKDDVHMEVIELMLEQLLPSISQPSLDAGILPGLALFQHIQQHSQHPRFQAMVVGQAGEKIWDVLQARLIEVIERTLVSTYSEKSVHQASLKITAQYLSGAFLELLKWWIKADMPYSPEQLDEIFQQLTLPGIRAVMENKSK